MSDQDSYSIHCLLSAKQTCVYINNSTRVVIQYEIYEIRFSKFVTVLYEITTIIRSCLSYDHDTSFFTFKEANSLHGKNTAIDTSMPLHLHRHVL